MSVCSSCPRRCGALRDENGGRGVCRSPDLPVVARAAAHCWEEPCISGTRGSGAVFFKGCNLRCRFCQNREISFDGGGGTVDIRGMRDILLRLRDTGVHNINLVTPSHFTEFLAETLSGIELGVPVVWNSSAYESPETLRLLQGLVQVYLPDMKYSLNGLAAKYSAAPDYPETARAAIGEMYRQTGPFRLDADGLLRGGVLIRHLVLPENLENSFGVIDWVSESFEPGQVMFSLMGQYTPNGEDAEYPELSRPLSAEEYAIAADYLDRSRIEDGYTQEPDASGAEYVPAFDGSGVRS